MINDPLTNFINSMKSPLPGTRLYEQSTYLSPEQISNIDFERYPTYFLGLDNEQIYGQYQTTPDKWKNAGAKFLGLTATTFAGGTIGLVNGITEAIANKDFSKFYDNNMTASFNQFNADLENKFANYTTEEWRNASWYSPQTWGSANFWADTVFKNMGFAVGAILAGGAWNKAFQLVGRGAGLIAKGAGWLDDAGQIAARGEDALTLSRSGNAIQKLESNLLNIAKRVNNSRITQNLGAYSQNLIRSTFAAAGEAQIEAYHAMDEYEKALTQKFVQETGAPPSEDQLKEIKEVSNKIGDTTFGINMGLLTASNLVMFPKIFGKNYSQGRQVVSESMRRGGIMNVVDAEGKIIRRGWNSSPSYNPLVGEKLAPAAFGVRNGVQNQLERFAVGRVLNRVSPYATAVFSPREAFEEGAQFIASEGSKNFFDTDSDVKGSLMATFKKTLGESLDNKDFWLGVMSGGISGGAMQTLTPYNFGGDIREARRSRAMGNQIANEINSSPLGNYTTELAQSVVREGTLSQASTEALLNGDRVQFEDMEHDRRMNYILPRVMYQRGDLVQQEIASYRDLASTEEGFSQMVADDKVEEGVTRTSFLAGLDQLEKDFNTVSAVFEELNTRFGNSFKPDGKTPTHNKDAIMRMAYNAAKIDNYNGRLSALSNELVGYNIDTADLMTILSEEGLMNSTEEATEKRKDVSQALTEYVSQLKTYLENSGVYTTDQIDDILEMLSDTVEITSRRRIAIDEYQLIRENPDAYDQTKQLNEETDDNEDVDELDEAEEITEEEEVLSPKRDFFRQNEGKPFVIDFGRRGTESGTLSYNPNNDSLAIRRADNTLYEITNQDFKDGLVRPGADDVVITESFLDQVDPRTEIKRRETLNNINDLHAEKRARIESVQQEIQSLKEELQSLANEMVDTATPDKVVAKLSETFVFGESLLRDLEVQQANLEEQLSTYRDILDERRSDYNTVIRDVEDQIDDIESLVNTLEQEKSRLEQLLDYIKDVVKSLAQRIKEKVDLVQRTRPTIVGEMLSGAMTNTISVLNSDVSPQEVISEFSNAQKALESSQQAYDINNTQKQQIASQLRSINDRLDFTYERLSNIDIVYSELINRHFEIVEPINPEDFVDKDIAVEDLNGVEDIVTTDDTKDNDQENIEIFEGKKKPLSRYFNSTVVLDDGTISRGAPQWHKNLQKALNRFVTLPAVERRKIGVMFLHPGNIYSFGLNDDVLTHLYQDWYKTKEAMLDPDTGALAVVFVKEENGGKYFINAEGNVLGKVGSENSISPQELVLSKMTDTDLFYKVNRKGEQKQEAYVKPEEVSISPEELQAEYRSQRESLFNQTEPGEIYSVTVSGGLSIDLGKKDGKVEGTLLHRESIEGTEQVLTVVPPNTRITTKNGSPFRTEAEAVVLVDTEDQATRLIVGNMNKDRATALLNAILRFGRKESADQRVVDFIKGAIPQKVKFDAANLTITKGGKTIDLKPLVDVNTPAKEANKLRDDIITVFENSKYNISQPMTEPFVEFTADGSPVVYPTFQQYLLSSDGRTPLLFTNVVKNNKTNRYVTVQGFMQGWNTVPSQDSQVQSDSVTTEDEQQPQEDLNEPTPEAQQAYEETVQRREQIRQHAETIKQQIRDVFGAHFDNAEQTAAGIAVLETLASSWAERNNTHPDYYYQRFVDVTQSTVQDIMQEGDVVYSQDTTINVTASDGQILQVRPQDIIENTSGSVPTKHVWVGDNLVLLKNEDYSLKSQIERAVQKATDPVKDLVSLLPSVTSEGGRYTTTISNTTITFRNQVNPVTDSKTGYIEIELVSTPEEYRGQRSARTAMEQFVEASDMAGVPLYLMVSPRDSQTTEQGLINFYSSLGFQDTGLEIEMTRQPNNVQFQTQQQGEDIVYRAAVITDQFNNKKLRALEKPDLGTLIHEFGHIAEEDLTDQEIMIVEQWSGKTRGTTEYREMFADGFLKFMAEAQPELSDINSVFSKIATWLQNLYKNIFTSRPELELNNDVRVVYSRLVGTEQAFSNRLNSALQEVRALDNNSRLQVMIKNKLRIRQKMPSQLPQGTEVVKKDGSIGIVGQENLSLQTKADLQAGIGDLAAYYTLADVSQMYEQQKQTIKPRNKKSIKPSCE